MRVMFVLLLVLLYRFGIVLISSEALAVFIVAGLPEPNYFNKEHSCENHI